MRVDMAVMGGMGFGLLSALWIRSFERAMSNAVLFRFVHRYHLCNLEHRPPKQGTEPT